MKRLIIFLIFFSFGIKAQTLEIYSKTGDEGFRLIENKVDTNYIQKLSYNTEYLKYTTPKVYGLYLVNYWGGRESGTYVPSSIKVDGVIYPTFLELTTKLDSIFQSFSNGGGGGGSAGYWAKSWNNIYNTNSGNVGIGTTTPTEVLDVVGKISLNDGGNSVFIGEGAGLNDDGTDNRNVGTGYQSLRSNTTGSNNVANGYYSLYSNTTGNSNVANGMYSLYSNTTGNSNVANGYSSLRYNTTGSNNVAQGYSSLYSNTTGNSNVANGMYSLRSNTTGSNNVANGYYSLYSNTTGNSNVAQGYQAARYIADGSTGRTTGDYGLYLGYKTKASADGTINENVIGYNTTGIGSNTVVIGNDNIVTTVLKGTVTIKDVLKLNPISSAPSSPTEGMIYSNNADHHLYFYDGTTWKQLDN